MPEVSVIIPVRDAGRHLRCCLDSVLMQTLRDLEVICVDDGSADDSPCLLAEYAEKDPRVKVLTSSGGGAGAARNVGLAAASGEWLHFVDADDLVRPDCAAAAVACGESEDADVVVFGADELDDPTGWLTPLPLDLSVRPGDTRFLKAYATSPWNKLFRRSFVARCGIRFQEIVRTNDLAFVVEALCRSGKTAILDRPLYRYRIHTGVSLQDTRGRTPEVGEMALAEADRRLKACGAPPQSFAALEVLARDVRATSRPHSFPVQVAISISRRGLVPFLKHAIGRLLGNRALRTPKDDRRRRVRFLVHGPKVGGGSEYVRRKIAEWDCEVVEKDPDLVHVNHLRCLLKWFLNPLRDRRAPVMFVVHGIHLRKYDFLPQTRANRIKRELRLLLERWLYSKVDELVALNADDVNMLRSVYGIRGPIRLEPNVVAPVESDSRQPEFAFVMVARFDFPKGQDVLLAAIAEAQDTLRPAKKRTLLIGGGETLAATKAFAAEKGIGDLVEFAGEIPNAAEQMWRGRILIAPSRWEGSPYAVLEAVARGKKVIASACPGNKDIIRDGENGWLFPVCDVKALAELLVKA